MKKIKGFIRKSFAVLLSAVTVMTLSACAGDIPSAPQNAADSPKLTGEFENGGSSLINTPDFINPMTGLACSREEAERRPIAVMINNIKKAQPQYGISEADIIYECNAEGGVNRLMALFSDYASVPTVGSVRSARDYFVNIATMHDAVFVHAGGASDAYGYIRDHSVENIDGVNGGGTEGKTFWRDKDRMNKMGYEHSLMTSGENIASTMSKLGFSDKRSRTETMYRFNATAVPLEYATTFSHVSIPHSNSITAEFDYNPDDGLFYRSQFGKEHIDAQTGKQLSFTNVVLIFTKQKVTDEKGRLDVKLTGGGDGYYLYGGRYIPIKWERNSEKELISLKNVDGSDLLLNPGKSFISVCANSIYSKVIFS